MDDLDLGSTIKGFVPGQKVFGRYTLRRILGRGGMGVVWLAHDESLDREVALKFLPEVVAADPRAVDDLKRETRRSLQLTHSHIVRIYDFIEDARTAAIAMEYVAGDTLAQKALAQPERVFSPAELHAWVEQLCGALDYAHSRRQVVHRDLKPANLMIDARGELKVTDFGIAASVSDSVSRVSAQAGSSGTPVYMSPQQMMGEKPAVTDDVYALGATLYELLTGRPPFYTGNILMQVQNKVPPPIAARRQELGVNAGAVPPEWETTIAACLAKEPKDRPQSAGEVCARLTRPSQVPGVSSATGAESRQAREAAVPMDRPRKAPRTARWVVAAAAVAAASLAGWWFGVAQPARRPAAMDAARGGLLVRTEPSGADVRVGGVGSAESPAAFDQLRVGDYEVSVDRAGYEPATLKLTVEESKFTQPPTVILRPLVGTAEVTSKPEGANFELRSTLLVAADAPAVVRSGETPAKLADLPIGNYSLLTRLKGWPDQVRELEIPSGRETRVTAEFVPGSFVIESNPSGAEVHFGERIIGKTPLRVAESIPGALSVELRLEGYKPRTLTGTIVAGQELKLSARLEGQRSAAEVKSILQRGALAHFPLRGDGNDRLGKNPAMRLNDTRFEHGGVFLHGQYYKYEATAAVPALDYNRFTVAVDFRSMAAAAEQQWVLVAGHGYRWLGLRSQNGKLALTLNNHRGHYELGGQAKTGVWQTIICSVDVPQRKILVSLDGELLPPVGLPADFRFEVVGSVDERHEREFMFTNYSNGGTFHGYVANLRVFNFAVPAADLKTMYELILPERPQSP